MAFAAGDITIKSIAHTDLEKIEALFEKEFGAELNMDIVKSRLRRLRQFYYALLPLRYLFSWGENLWNIFIIKNKDTFAGFIQFSLAGQKRLHLDFIALTKKQRGQGLGKYVLRRWLKEFADAKGEDVLLEVRLGNPAYHLYQALGFKPLVQILHYEKEFTHEEYPRQNIVPSIRLETVQPWERGAVYELYQQSLPEIVKRLAREEKKTFYPSMYQRQLIWLKNQLMRSRVREYVICFKHQVISFVKIRSYRKSQYHILTMYIEPAYELLRKEFMQKILCVLTDRYGEGTVSTTIYHDVPSKQEDLNQLGFLQKEAYFLMYRRAASLRPISGMSRRFIERGRAQGRKHVFKKKIKI